MNNMPDPLLSGNDLPTFKFALEKSKAKVIGNRTGTLEKGDVGYIPQGHGHSLENVGNNPRRVLIGFNSGIYEDIDLSEWMAGNPVDVLATNFAKPASLFEKFPKKDIFIADKEGH